MALFFDKDWFDAALTRAGLTRETLALALGLDDTQIGEVWKDQRELSAREVATIAALFAVTPEAVAHHAGVSTPVPRPASEAPGTLNEIAARLERVETKLDELKALMLELRRAP